jgi:hypothetical protein
MTALHVIAAITEPDLVAARSRPTAQHWFAYQSEARLARSATTPKKGRAARRSFAVALTPMVWATSEARSARSGLTGGSL